MCSHCGYKNLPGAAICKYCQQDLTSLNRHIPDSQLERFVTETSVATVESCPPRVLPPSATVREAIEIMLSQNVGAILVVDGEGKSLGIFTERDLLKKVVGLVDGYQNLPISQFMTPKPEAVSPDDKLDIVLQLMDAGGYRHVPVLEHGKPVRLLSVRDMLKHLMKLSED